MNSILISVKISFNDSNKFLIELVCTVFNKIILSLLFNSVFVELLPPFDVVFEVFISLIFNI